MWKFWEKENHDQHGASRNMEKRGVSEEPVGTGRVSRAVDDRTRVYRRSTANAREELSFSEEHGKYGSEVESREEHNFSAPREDSEHRAYEPVQASNQGHFDPFTIPIEEGPEEAPYEPPYSEEPYEPPYSQEPVGGSGWFNQTAANIESLSVDELILGSARQSSGIKNVAPDYGAGVMEPGDGTNDVDASYYTPEEPIYTSYDEYLKAHQWEAADEKQDVATQFPEEMPRPVGRQGAEDSAFDVSFEEAAQETDPLVAAVDKMEEGLKGLSGKLLAQLGLENLKKEQFFPGKEQAGKHSARNLDPEQEEPTPFEDMKFWSRIDRRKHKRLEKEPWHTQYLTDENYGQNWGAQQHWQEPPNYGNGYSAYDYNPVNSGSQKPKRRFRLKHILIIALVIVVAWGALLGLSLRNGESFLDGDAAMVTTAREEIGNTGGEKYWTWYGFDSWADWCACFVSWCADQNGYISAGKVPKFAYVQEGVNWFQEQGKWRDAGETPEPGDIIFFDWNDNGVADHVGIVAGCHFMRVFTIEGNTGINTKGTCMRKSYWVFSNSIMGYGIP